MTVEHRALNCIQLCVDLHLPPCSSTWSAQFILLAISGRGWSTAWWCCTTSSVFFTAAVCHRQFSFLSVWPVTIISTHVLITAILLGDQHSLGLTRALSVGLLAEEDGVKHDSDSTSSALLCLQSVRTRCRLQGSCYSMSVVTRFGLIDFLHCTIT